MVPDTFSISREGGAGFDTYIYNAGDGTDRIEDDVLKLALTR